MDYTQDTTKHIKGKHFSYGDRRELQGMLSAISMRCYFIQIVNKFNYITTIVIVWRNLKDFQSVNLFFYY